MSLDSRDVGLGSWISNPAVSSKENMHGHSPEDGDLIQAPTEVFSGQQDSSAKVLVVSGTGGLTHAAPVLELGRILARRGHRVEFATHRGQEKWVNSPDYSFISRTHTMGDPMTAEKEAAHYLHMQQTDARRDYRDYFLPKFTVDAFWASDYQSLKEVIQVSRPDMIVADFFVDAVRDIQHQFGIPVATLWPQMPYGMAGAPYIPGVPGLQIDALSSEHASLWTRVRAAFRPLRTISALIPYFWFIRNMRRAAGVTYSLFTINKPNYLVLVNSFWGLETPKDLPPLMAAVGPILADEYPSLDDKLEALFASHHRVVFISFGTHVLVPPEYLQRLLLALSSLLEEGLIDGIIWVAKDAQRTQFNRAHCIAKGSDVRVGELLDNKNRAWLFTPFAPQRAILDRPETILFMTHGGGSSVNEAAYHGTPMLVLGFFFDQLLNGLRVQEAGIGMYLDKAAFTGEEVLQKARTILADEGGVFSRDIQRMKHIARVSSRKKEYGADLIEEVMFDAIFSKLPPADEGDKLMMVRRRRPMHLQTADSRMSVWKARNWDLTVLGLLVTGSFVGVAYVGYVRLIKS
ncbi:UDP-glucosyl transferase family protein [Verticillium dahliae VdLs.17]|uniref:UDP-glucosyl transferase family protein n=2 Tax=Verticillium dahliae TaxID=27337 RepID=G2XDF0_VERDV|nr:UDP-glucosyl transferase family protein [Verticillium dahliae VdLs.17]EGY17018.1 UDP-glucosyl transferase family protein [Verticillium dahliae VdLs.17]KAF3347775.1 hypothetical protein VdG2_04011 [Verticillium dahliae VDG2]KAH6696104.1 UDP-glucosyl transferase family protein [Verticillium dahliae]